MRVIYYFVLIPISLLPHKLLYVISDILFFLTYYVFKYRKKIVFLNLRNSFPEKKQKEIVHIAKSFYMHFCDLIVESIKGFTITKKEIKKRLVIKNPEITNKFADSNKSICIVGGHYNNWEICAQAFSIYSKHKCIGIYKPLKNKFLNNKLNYSRTKFGLNLVSMRVAKKSFVSSNSKSPIAIIFGSDQNPSNPKKAFWLKFLNQDTGVLFGAEKYSKEYNFPIIFVSISKVKRGFYEAKYSLISSEPKNEKHGVITKKFTRKLEKDIIKQPAFWLWTHKRWKHKRN